MNTKPQDIAPGFFGRSKELEQLKYHLLSRDAKVGCIIGAPGSGKTFLARHFCGVYEESLVGEAFYIPASSLVSISDKVYNEVPYLPHRTLLVIDDADLIEKQLLAAELRRISEARPQARFLLILRSPHESDLVEFSISVDAFNEEEYSQLMRALVGNSLSKSDINQLFTAFRGNPFSAKLSSALLQNESFSFSQLMEAVKPFTLSTLMDYFGNPLPDDSKSVSKIIFDVKTISIELKRLSHNPELLYELSPRKFEEVMAETFRSQGYDVTLTQSSRDGGVDLYVAQNSLVGSFLYLVECKKYAPNRSVGVGVVRQIHGVLDHQRATAGIIATTSFFSKAAKEYQQNIKYQISLQDYFGIQMLLKAAVK